MVLVDPLSLQRGRPAEYYIVIEQEICIFLTLFLHIQRFFLVILNLHNSKTTCDRRKPIVDLEYTPKNVD